MTMLQRRLRLPVYPSDFYCPACHGVCDEYGDHPLTCSGGGDRTVRHNLIRNELFRIAKSAGLRPELEKQGVLRPRPHIGSTPEDGLPQEGIRGPDGRRPADVFIPSFGTHGKTAVDVAVTSGLRMGYGFISAMDGTLAARTYETRKCSFLDTAAHCRSEGVHFLPFVVEGAGGSFGPSARKILSLLANASAKLTGECPAKMAEQFSQRLSLILHETNARSILLRASREAAPPASLTAARAILEHAEMTRRSVAAFVA